MTTGRSVNFTGEIIERTATPFNFIIRSNDAEDTPEKENRELRAALRLYRLAKAREKSNDRHLSHSSYVSPCLAAAFSVSFSLTL